MYEQLSHLWSVSNEQLQYLVDLAIHLNSVLPITGILQINHCHHNGHYNSYTARFAKYIRITVHYGSLLEKS